jgi:flavodoxin
MNSLVIYASRTGTTRKVAEAIADTLRSHGPCEVVAAEAAPVVIPRQVDLVVIGGPTEAHGVTAAITEAMDRFASGSLAGRLAAAFDTRVRWPLWLSGSAGSKIADRLHQAGAIVVMPQESFFVTRKPELEDGELGRARAWGAALVAAMEEQAVPV